MNVDGYQPMVGSSYIKLPEYIKNKKAVINPKNDDQECFAWAMTIGQNLDKIPIHPERINDYARELRNISINEKNINYPVEVDNRVYKKIINENDFIFNVYSYDYNNDKFMLYPLFITEQPKSKHVNLLYFTSK